jgi:peptide/nickel transport system ATP-binding protein
MAAAGAEPRDGDHSTVGRRLLEVDGLSLELRTPLGPAQVLDGVSLAVDRGEVLGLVGESGSGKTITALSLLGLVPRQLIQRVTGTVTVDGKAHRADARKELATLRGREVAMVFQEARRSLDPAFSVGAQIAETVRRHRGVSRRAAWQAAVEALDRVHIPNAAERAREHPRSFSGGMCQRVMIALALACRPKVLIADEPTTALDVTVQAAILDLLREIQEDTGLATIFITHDLAVVSQMCDRVAVLYGGQVMEEATALDLFLRPRHPYTERLLASLPQRHAHGGRLGVIPGAVPPAVAWPPGCRFHPRCAHAREECASDPVTVVPAGDGHHARCVRADEIRLAGIDS